jgi:hypothetical protein
MNTDERYKKYFQGEKQKICVYLRKSASKIKCYAVFAI